MNTRLPELEEDILNLLLKGEDPILASLRAQLQVAVPRPRRMSGVGFFTEFDVPANTIHIPGDPSFAFGDVVAEIEGLQHGAGFVLFVRNGLISMLEGYSFDEPWPTPLKNYKVKYNPGPERDMAALKATPNWPVRTNQ